MKQEVGTRNFFLDAIDVVAFSKTEVENFNIEYHRRKALDVGEKTPLIN